MTKQQFVDEHRHELFGMVTDAAVTQARGAPLSIFLRELAKKIDRRLEMIYDELTKPPPPGANGKAALPQVKNEAERRN